MGLKGGYTDGFMVGLRIEQVHVDWFHRLFKKILKPVHETVQ